MYQFEEKSEWLKNLEEELIEDLEGIDEEEVDKNSLLESLKDMVRIPLDLDSAIRVKTAEGVRDLGAELAEELKIIKLEEVKDAWNVPGRAPGYHQKMQNKLRKEWPVLAAALDRL